MNLFSYLQSTPDTEARIRRVLQERLPAELRRLCETDPAAGAAALAELEGADESGIRRVLYVLVGPEAEAAAFDGEGKKAKRGKAGASENPGGSSVPY